MTTPTLHPPPRLPHATSVRMQHLLDEADRSWFSRNPGASYRLRFYFIGEKIEGDGETSRHVVVRIERDGLIRRFADAEVVA